MARSQPPRAKGQQTRAQLLVAAEEVFSREGFLNARVADIVEVAGVAHGTFYTYFESKEDIFRETAEALVDEFYAHMSSRADPSLTAAGRIQLANRRYIEMYERRAGMLGVLEQVATFNPEMLELRLRLRRRFIARIERAIERLKEEDPSLAIDAHVAANALGGMVDNFAYVRFVLGESYDDDVSLETLDQIWFSALHLT
jgi:AcrR family transcriptional regulator